MTTGKSLNCSSRSFQSRIDELPTNSTPPAGRGSAASSAANAVNAASHRDGAIGASAVATTDGSAAQALKATVHRQASAAIRCLRGVNIRAGSGEKH
jgi:hypothetical protein